MLGRIAKGFTKLMGTKSDKDIKQLMPLVEQVNEEFAKLASLTDDQLREKTGELRTHIKTALKSIDDQIHEHQSKIDDNIRAGAPDAPTLTEQRTRQKAAAAAAKAPPAARGPPSSTYSNAPVLARFMQPDQLAAFDAFVGVLKTFSDTEDWFQALYEILLGQSQGPRFGSFIALYGVSETRAVLAPGLAGDLAA